MKRKTPCKPIHPTEITQDTNVVITHENPPSHVVDEASSKTDDVLKQEVIHGDSLTVLPTLESESAQILSLIHI